MKTFDVKLDNKTAKGIEIQFPNAVLVAIIGSKGFLMCGYLDVEAAEKLGDCAAVIKGVKTVDDMLSAKIVKLTPQAQSLGIEIGMTGRQALSKLI